jgi:hypothetical protein
MEYGSSLINPFLLASFLSSRVISTPFSRRAKMSVENISLEEIEHAYKIAARIVAKFGDAYLHTFQRLHEELQIRYQQQDLKSIALNVAQRSKK